MDSLPFFYKLWDSKDIDRCEEGLRWVCVGIPSELEGSAYRLHQEAMCWLGCNSDEHMDEKIDNPVKLEPLAARNPMCSIIGQCVCIWACVCVRPP